MTGTTQQAVAPVLELRGLTTEFKTQAGVVRAVDDVSYQVAAGETLGVVGESGCGKSVTSLSILRLIPDPPGRIVSGAVLFHDEDLTQVPEHRIRAIRGNEIAMIFQEPMTSLNPMMSIGKQLSEPLIRHRQYGQAEAQERVEEMLNLVHIPDAKRWLNGYPHEMSGGMRQRAMIALALACRPQVLLADEPTTALDATVQIQILLLLRELQRELGLAIVFVTHDMGAAVEVADRFAVMYAGRIVEEGPTREVIRNPRHPYTLALMQARADGAMEKGARLASIPGAPPDLAQLPTGCAFAERCTFVQPACLQSRPEAVELGGGHRARCLRTDATAQAVAQSARATANTSILLTETA